MKRLFVSLLVALSVFTPALASRHSATCRGAKNCRACKTCEYCKHCAKNGGKCGVCSKTVSSKEMPPGSLKLPSAKQSS